MPKYKRARPLPGETEFTGTQGRSDSGVSSRKPAAALSASEQMRLSRLTDPNDPDRKINRRIWHGETPEPTPAQAEGDRLS